MPAIPDSNYPAFLDNYVALNAAEVQPDLNNASAHVRKALAGVTAIEATLGVNPQGGYSDVVARLNASDASLAAVSAQVATIQTQVDAATADIATLQAALSGYLPLSGGTLTGDLLLDASVTARTIQQAGGSSHRLLVQNNSSGEGVELFSQGASIRACNTGTPRVYMTANGTFLDMGGAFGPGYKLSGQTNSAISQNVDLPNGTRISNAGSANLDLSSAGVAILSPQGLDINLANKATVNKDVEITDSTKGIILHARTGVKKFRVYVVDDTGALATEEV